MADKVRRVDYSPDEYISGVGGVLSAAEQGVYWMVCSLIMSEGHPIENDERRVAGLCRMRPAEARRTIDRLIERGKIDLTEAGELAQKRAQSEVEKSAKRIQIAIENGSKGGRPKPKDKEKQQIEEPTGLSSAKLTTNYQLPTEEKTSEETSDVCPKPAKRRHSYPSRFEEFWSGYPTDALMSKKKAADAFGRLTDEDQDIAIRSLPAFNAYCSQHNDYRPVHAVKFITDRRFDGFIKAVNAEAQREFVAMDSELWRSLLHLRGVVSMPHKDFNGRRGWTFERAEIERAEKLGHAPNWRGAA